MEELIQKIIHFRNERGWEKTDTPETLAKSIAVEAAELLQNFQWGKASYNEENVKEELADIIIYSLAMVHDLDFDLEKIIEEKLVKNARRYPIKK